MNFTASILVPHLASCRHRSRTPCAKAIVIRGTAASYCAAEAARKLRTTKRHSHDRLCNRAENALWPALHQSGTGAETRNLGSAVQALLPALRRLIVDGGRH